MTHASSPTNPAVKQGPTSGSALVKGCLIVAAIVVIGGITLVVGGYYAFQHYMNKFTDDQPMALPVVEMDQDTYDTLAARAETFAEAIDAGQDTQPFQLNETELNALIQNHSDWEDIAENIYVTIEGDSIGGQISMPFGERYVNATATFEFRFANGQLYLYIKDATVKGEAVPDTILSQMRNENLAAEMMNDPDTQAFFENIEAVEVTDGKIVVTPK